GSIALDLFRPAWGDLFRPASCPPMSLLRDNVWAASETALNSPASFGGPAALDAVDGQPTIDDQLGAGNILGFVGGEEQRRVRDIPSIAHAPHRTLRVTTTDH